MNRSELFRHAGVFVDAARSAGPTAALSWYGLRALQKFGRAPRVAKLRPHQVSEPLTVHLGGTSDMLVFEQIFINEEYRCLRDLKDVSLVLDLGANVGYSSAYLLGAFPKAKVVAIEPDGRNFEMCRNNLAPYGQRATVLHGAAWSECTKVRLSSNVFGDGLDWARQVEQPGNADAGDIEAWDVGTLIGMAGAEKVDLLKVDIECGELVVFGESSKHWLHRVRNICIELHGQDCKETFFRALADFDYELSHSEELTICRNLRAKAGRAVAGRS